uniref:Uncharacterized protein n=1 Tax=Manihot esculenta TaxID=3983 RepID=A0A2C9VD07_MANES
MAFSMLVGNKPMPEGTGPWVFSGMVPPRTLLVFSLKASWSSIFPPVRYPLAPISDSTMVLFLLGLMLLTDPHPKILVRRLCCWL